MEQSTTKPLQTQLATAFRRLDRWDAFTDDELHLILHALLDRHKFRDPDEYALVRRLRAELTIHQTEGAEHV